MKQSAVSLKRQILDIVQKNSQLERFWSQSYGWAPAEVAKLLASSRLDWQVSLSKTLEIWIREEDIELSPGELILAWVNLRSLLEGTLRLFLSIYMEDYKGDVAVLREVGAVGKDGKHYPASDLKLDKIIRFCKKNEFFSADTERFLETTQQRGNAIHAFNDRAIGTTEDFYLAIGEYLKLLRHVDKQLPYP